MPAKKISELKTLTIASGNEYIPVVENGVTYKMDMNTVADFIESAANSQYSSEYYYDGVKKASANIVNFDGDGCSVEEDPNNSRQVNINIPKYNLDFSINDDILPDKVSKLHFNSNRISKTFDSGVAIVNFDGELPATANVGDVLTWNGSIWEGSPAGLSKTAFDIDGISDCLASKLVVLSANGLSATIDGSGVLTLHKVRGSTDGIMNLMGDVSANIGSSSPTNTYSTVIKLRGYHLSETEPNDNDVLTYTGGKWTPIAPSSTTFFGDVSASTGVQGVTANIVGIQNIPISGNPVATGNFLAYDSVSKKLNWTALPAPGLSLSQVQNVISTYKEKATIITTSNPATILIQASISTFLYYSSNSNANDYTVNVQSTTTEKLSTYLPNAGDSSTIVLVIKASASPKKLTKFQIDGKDYTVKWQEGTTGTIPNGLANSIHSWCFSIIKTTNNPTAADYLILGSLTNFN